MGRKNGEEGGGGKSGREERIRDGEENERYRK